MADDKVVSFIGDGSISELDLAIEKLNQIDGLIVKLNEDAKKGELKISGAEKISELNEGIKLASTNLEKLGTISVARTAAIEKQTRAETQAIKDVSNEYKQLGKAYAEAALRAKNYALVLGQAHPITVEAIKDANALNDKLKTVDASVGQFSRNVGNYNAVGTQFNQLLRELPNAGISFNTFILSLSNNVSYFGEAIKKARGEGQSWGTVLKSIGTSLFSVTGILNALVLGMVLYSDKIFQASKATTAAEKATKKYTDSLNSIDESSRNAAQQELAHLQILTKLATTTDTSTKSTKAQQRAVDELQRLYPQTLKNYTDEAIKAGQASTAIDELTKSIIAKSVAEAAEKKFAAAGEQVYALYLAQDKATKALSKSEKELSEIRKSNNVNTISGSLTQSNAAIGQAEIRAVRAKKDLADISLAYLNAQKEQKKYLADAQKFAQEAGAGFIDERKDPKTKTAKRAFDPTNIEISAAERINKAKATLNKVELEDEKNKAQSIYQNDLASLDERLKAHSDYLNAILALAEIEQKTELQNIELNLSKIDSIEQKAVSKRSNAEKSLLLQKGAFEAEKLAITAKNTVKTNEILDKSQKESLSIIKHSVDEETKYRISAQEKIIQNIDIQERAEIAALESQNLTSKEYNQKRQEIAAKYAGERVQQTIDYLQQEIDAIRAAGGNVTDIESKLNEARISADESYVAKRVQLETDLANRIMAIQHQIMDAAVQLGEILLSSESKRIEENKAKIEENKTYQIDAINQQIATEEEKNARIASVEAQAMQDKRKLDEQQKQIEKRKFQLEQAAALARVFINTTETVAKLRATASVLLSNPVTAPLAPLALSQIPLAITSGAIAAGLIGAQLLAYAQGAGIDGKPVHPGGLFVAGDGGEKELIVTPRGDKYWSENKPHLYNEPYGTRVIPESKLMNNLGVLPNISNKEKQQNIINMFDAKGIIHAIERNKPHVTIIHNDNSTYNRLKGRS